VQQRSARLADQDLHGSDYAVRGAAFVNPRNLEKSRTRRRIMIQLLSGSDSWALAQICVEHIRITKDQHLAAIRGPESSLTRIGVG